MSVACMLHVCCMYVACMLHVMYKLVCIGSVPVLLGNPHSLDRAVGPHKVFSAQPPVAIIALPSHFCIIPLGANNIIIIPLGANNIIRIPLGANNITRIPLGANNITRIPLGAAKSMMLSAARTLTHANTTTPPHATYTQHATASSAALHRPVKYGWCCSRCRPLLHATCMLYVSGGEWR